MEKRNVSIIRDINEDKVVVIHDIRFKGKRNVSWEDVEKYLKCYIGEFYEIAESKDIVYLGKDLSDEYAGSVYTRSMKGASAKAKANAAQGLPELIEIATHKRFKENKKEKHSIDAAFGWYRYDSRFALPVYDENDELERYNVFHAEIIIRHANDGKLYLYDMINVKKEPSNPPKL